ncbi:hypothetical protein [Streptomyces canus]|nr:hypothetical protein [Streptomyces canus]
MPRAVLHGPDEPGAGTAALGRVHGEFEDFETVPPAKRVGIRAA